MGRIKQPKERDHRGYAETMLPKAGAYFVSGTCFCLKH